MFFNSINFAIFLPIVFILYWFATKRNFKLQNILLIIASYFFYASWDYRFLFLLIFSTFLDYYTGIKIEGSQSQNRKRFWLWLSICINIGFLGVFKYYNFFISSFADGLSLLGIKSDFWTLQVILPVGISFYTFHGLSYILDIYNDRIKPEKNFISYSVFVSFFPLLVAGPIERARHLLPQICSNRTFDYSKAVDGLRQILWGLFKKIVIADNCAVFANKIFNNSSDYSGETLVLGAVFFAFQIYGDFSGYSDIAIGTSRLFGIDIIRNFAYPYFSRDIAEFWRRWHISLNTWFRDYLYIPLGGSRDGKLMTVRNIFIIFLVCGFWHGANWTFLIWGALNAIYFLPLLLLNRNRHHLEIVAYGKYLPSLKELINMLITFGLTVFAWIFFRVKSIGHAFDYINQIFDCIWKHPGKIFLITFWEHRWWFLQSAWYQYSTILIFLFIFLLIEWVGREQEYAIEKLGLKWSRFLRWTFYYTIILVVFYFSGKPQQFIYFQF